MVLIDFILLQGIFEGLEKDLKSFAVSHDSARGSIRGSISRVAFNQASLLQSGVMSSIIPLARSLFREKSDIKNDISEPGSSLSSINHHDDDDDDDYDEKANDNESLKEDLLSPLDQVLEIRPSLHDQTLIDRIDITTLSCIPNKMITKSMGRISLHFVKVILSSIFY